MKNQLKYLILICGLFCGLNIFSQPGNTCENAIAVGEGQFIGTISFGFSASNPAECFVGSGVDATWYVYTPSIDGRAYISSCLGGTNTRLIVHEGSCDSLICFGMTDDDCPCEPGSGELLAAAGHLDVSVGNEYYIE